MVMLTTETPAQSRRQGRSQAHGTSPGPFSGLALASRPGIERPLGFRLSDTLSSDPASFVQRQRQPYGE